MKLLLKNFVRNNPLVAEAMEKFFTALLLPFVICAFVIYELAKSSATFSEGLYVSIVLKNLFGKYYQKF